MISIKGESAEMKILCLGSMNIDHVYQVNDFVQAGETIASLSMEDHCGGKGLNQAVALKQAGCDVYMAGMVGADGTPLLALLKEKNVNVSCVRTLDNTPSGHAIIQVDPKGQNCIIIHGGANVCIDKDYIDSVYARFEPGDIVLLQNEISCLPYAIRRAHELRLRVTLNPSPITPQLAACEELTQVDWFVLNEIEGNLLTGKTNGNDICQTMKEKYPSAKVMLTLGKKGCMLYDGETFHEHGIYDVSVVDTTAAGDTFTGYFLAGINENLPLAKVLELASTASSLTISRAGAAGSIPDRREVDDSRLKLT